MIVDIFADIACPWCYIGERRLQKALGARSGLEIDWRWRPFQLRPDMPVEGYSWDDFVDRKFGGMDRARPIFARVTSAGEEERIEFRFDKIITAPNTGLAHRLVLLAQERGLQRGMVERLFRAHFTEGLDVGDLKTLVQLAAEAGLDAEEVEAYMGSDEGAEEVRESQDAAERLGISGVPFFIFDGKYGLSGAQPLEVFLEAVDMASSEVAVS